MSSCLLLHCPNVYSHYLLTQMSIFKWNGHSLLGSSHFRNQKGGGLMSISMSHFSSLLQIQVFYNRAPHQGFLYFSSHLEDPFPNHITSPLVPIQKCWLLPQGGSKRLLPEATVSTLASSRNFHNHHLVQSSYHLQLTLFISHTELWHRKSVGTNITVSHRSVIKAKSVLQCISYGFKLGTRVGSGNFNFLI